MDITYNKVDETALPISTNRVSASEYNQIAGSLMHIITTAGLTPDSQNNAQLLNALKQAVVNFPYITETYHNGTEWYRVWSDGWCEQGGEVANSGTNTKQITFLKAFADTNYYFNRCNESTNTGTATSFAAEAYTDKQTSGIKIYCYSSITKALWKAEGYIS